MREDGDSSGAGVAGAPEHGSGEAERGHLPLLVDRPTKRRREPGVPGLCKRWRATPPCRKRPRDESELAEAPDAARLRRGEEAVTAAEGPSAASLAVWGFEEAATVLSAGLDGGFDGPVPDLADDLAQLAGAASAAGSLPGVFRHALRYACSAGAREALSVLRSALAALEEPSPT